MLSEVLLNYSLDMFHIVATTIIGILVTLILIKYHWSRRKLYALAYNLEGPISLPIIGNAYIFIGPIEDYLMKMVKFIGKYKTPMRFWLGADLLICFSDVTHIGKILSSNKVTHKHNIYDYLKSFGGEGLITSSGSKWKAGRKLIQPLYNAKFVADSLNIFTKHVNYSIKKMENYVNKDAFCVEGIIHKCTMDIISETILGIKIDPSSDENLKMMQAMKEMYSIVFPRMVKPWLHPDFIYNLTPGKKKEIQVLNIFSKYFNRAVNLGKEAYLNNAILDITKENHGFLPSIIELTKRFHNNDLGLTEKDFTDNLITLFAASEDTVTSIAAAACVCFGMYPEYQEKAAKEVRTVLYDSEQITYEDVTKLTYLDMCVKDVLRLFPIGPFIMRETTEDFEIDKWVVPKNCALLIPIFTIHLDPKYWERPMDFFPDHFTEKAVNNRPTFSYLPFSAGPRGCIGKIFAQTSIKVLLARFLQQYVIEADGNYSQFYEQLRADISVRSKSGYYIKIKKRKWDN